MRPQPPAALFEPVSLFLPDESFAAWLRCTFIEDGAVLCNPEHAHLQWARLGVLWTNVANTRQGKIVAATAEMPDATRGSRWQMARSEFQLCQWFHLTEVDELNFLLTFDANIAAALDDASFCALCEHELYHCGQKLDEFGQPKFNRKTSLPVWCLRGHDVEAFVGVTRRYGVGAAEDGISELLAAAKQPPQIGKAKIGAACGTCKLRLA
jgi:hypothetical protein